MRYYVVSDIHGYYTPFIKALTEKGFFDDKEPHKLIVCGDLFDRGYEAKELQDFILKLMEKDEVILIKGNHEDLFLQLIYEDDGLPVAPHIKNGTYNTGLQLCEGDDTQYIVDNYVECAKKTPYVTKIIPSMLNYYETEHYIFVHGWIPSGLGVVKYISRWRDVYTEAWEAARWLNGMQMWKDGVREEGKTIVCGHYTCSYGHSRFEGGGDEFGLGADFTPFVADGIIAIDACTKLSGIVNCVVIED